MLREGREGAGVWVTRRQKGRESDSRGGAVSEGTNQKMVRHMRETDTMKPISLLI